MGSLPNGHLCQNYRKYRQKSCYGGAFDRVVVLVVVATYATESCCQTFLYLTGAEGARTSGVGALESRDAGNGLQKIYI